MSLMDTHYTGSSLQLTGDHGAKLKLATRARIGNPYWPWSLFAWVVPGSILVIMPLGLGCG